MAPAKKNVDVDKVKTPPAKRIRRTKPPLKIPSVISIKIPVRGAPVPETPPVGAQQLNKRHLSASLKLDLANEVARAQLVKSVPFSEPSNPIVVPKRGRQRKVLPSLSVENNVAKEPPTKTPKKVVNKRVIPAKTEIEEKATPKKRQADTAIKRTIKRQKLTVQAEAIEKKIKTENKPTRRIIRRSCRGKKQDLINADGSPSILTGYDASPKTEIDTVQAGKVIDSSPKAQAARVKGASLIESRKTSVNSTASSGPSWIRDISSTSTTTCVTVSSNEFIRFNHKLPVIKLTSIDYEVGKYKNNNIDDTSSSTSETNGREHRYSEQSDRGIRLDSPKLSASSSSGSSNSDTEVGHANKMELLLNKLTSILKKFDMEVINGLRFDNEEIGADLKRLKDKLFDIVDSEFGIITHCKRVRQILDPQSVGDEDIPPEIPEVQASQGVVEYSAPSKMTPDSNKNMSFDVNVKNIVVAAHKSSDSEPNELDLQNFTSNKFNYTRFDQCDDDDALSLYAESLTGIDPSRLNSSMASVSDAISEEYTPRPLKNKYISPDKYVYCPTKIAEPSGGAKPKTICEKQNADSTSIFKETYQHTIIKQNPDSTSVHREAFDEQENIVEPAVTDNGVDTEVASRSHRPFLMLSQFKPVNVTKSVVFKGVCFFNLINSCKKYGQQCRFPHVAFDASEINNRLAKTSEECFIQEYITMRSWPELRRMYGRCFVHECVRRELTRILVEMALDFVKKANPKSKDDLALKCHVAEITLLHLNKVGFSECADLLNYSVHQETQLCDFFMDVIAHTQNFSRFKRVFIDLASYMVRTERTFDLTVASAILERVCILPYDEGLARAFLDIVKNTNRNIFENSMIGHFEKQIAEKELYEEYLSVKRLRRAPERPGCEPPPPPPGLQLELEPAGARPEDDSAAHSLSPDTTDYNNMNKNSEEPIFTRIMNFNRPPAHKPNVPPTFVDPIAPEPQRVIRKDLPFVNWMNTYPNTRQQFRAMRPHYGPQRSMRPMGTPPKLPKRLVTYAGSPTRYTPRWPGPNY